MYKQSICTIILASCKLENPQNVDDFKGWDKYREKFKYFFPGPSGWFYTASMDKISLWNFFFSFFGRMDGLWKFPGQRCELSQPTPQLRQ